MDLLRRDLLKAGVSAAVLAAVPRPLSARGRGAILPAPVPPITDPDVKELALRAIDAARHAGADYADVRLTYSKRRMFSAVQKWFNHAPDEEELHVGVRALVNGYWGFASGTLWAKDEMDRLGHQAVALAKVNTSGKERRVELAPTPVIRDGNWVTPMAIDPFEVSPFEIADYLDSLSEFIARVALKGKFRNWTFNPVLDYECRGQERAFASSEGSFCTQRLQTGLPMVGLWIMENGQPKAVELVDHVPQATSLGWEVFTGQPLRDYIVEVMDSMIAEQLLPTMNVEVGRFDAVCDARTVASLIHSTLSAATQLDRALGYEANATGTSYLSDPLGMLGAYAAGSPQLSLIGERSSRGGAASVQWDDEGVTPEDFPIIKDGVLVNFQTTRESATWLKDRYAAESKPVRSNGCAGSTNAVAAPIQTSPNLKLVPGKEALDVNALMTNVGNGVVIRGMMPPNRIFLPNGKTTMNMGNIDVDYQALNGFTVYNFLLPGRIGRVKEGKQVARIMGGSVSFKSSELWKGLLAVGGEAAVRAFGIRDYKGEPQQDTYHTVMTPPAAFKQLTVIRSN